MPSRLAKRETPSAAHAAPHSSRAAKKRTPIAAMLAFCRVLPPLELGRPAQFFLFTARREETRRRGCAGPDRVESYAGRIPVSRTEHSGCIVESGGAPLRSRSARR